MLEHLAAKGNAKTLALHPVTKKTLKRWLRDQPKPTKQWVQSAGFAGEPGKVLLVPGADGAAHLALVGTGKGLWSWAAIPNRLPVGRYRIDAELDATQAQTAALGWALGCYEFARYKKPKKTPATLVWPEGCDRGRVTRLVEGIGLARDLINTPAGDMGPSELAAAARKLARKHDARCTITVGKQLLAKNYPAIHAVGRACAQEPRLVDLRWGQAGAPKLTLVGKGVCFDTGGLDLKNPANMKLMKKDMGGAATVLGLAHAIMDAKLPVRLRVLVPAVENSVGGNAFHPLDVLQTRKGMTVEVGNTDAEGRLVLCDALAEADAENPDLIIDLATLTGAARVALGTELPALFCTDDGAAEALLSSGETERDPLWRLPLHTPYRSSLDSKVADINNISAGGYGGAITAALFLKEFVSKGRAWMHIDTMAWSLTDKAGRPQGGDAPGLRALYAMLEQRYPKTGGRRKTAKGRGQAKAKAKAKANKPKARTKAQTKKSARKS